MRPILRTSLAALAIVLLAADPPAARFLLLDTRQILTGDIERTGDHYRVRRDGGETTVPVSRVVFACAERGEIYRYLSERTDSKNADQQVKLAQWCQANDFAPEAVVAAKAAVELRPKHEPSLRLLKYCEETAARPRPQPIARPAQPALLPESVDCSPESLRQFRTRVQPVLMNACAQCHLPTARYPLQRVHSDSLNRIGTFQNLSATMAQVDRARPAASMLLQKALTAHGGAAIPPLRDRGNAAYQHLEQWVRMIATDGGAVPVSVTPETPAATATTSAATGFAGTRADDKPTGPKDPFDPIDFNKSLPPPKPPKD